MGRHYHSSDEWEDARIQLERSPSAAAEALRVLFESDLLVLAFEYTENPDDALAMVNGAIMSLANHREKLATLTLSQASRYAATVLKNRGIDAYRSQAHEAGLFTDLGLSEEWEPIDQGSLEPFVAVEIHDERHRAFRDEVGPLLEPAIESFVRRIGKARRAALLAILDTPRANGGRENSKAYFARIGSRLGISGGRAEVYWSEIKTALLDELRAAVPTIALDRPDMDDVVECLAERTRLPGLLLEETDFAKRTAAA